MFHRNHVARFIAALDLTPDERAGIEERAETAIAEFTSHEEGHFSGARLEEVLGNPELTHSFNDMWERQQLSH